MRGALSACELFCRRGSPDSVLVGLPALAGLGGGVGERISQGGRGDGGRTDWMQEPGGRRSNSPSRSGRSTVGKVHASGTTNDMKGSLNR